MKVHEELPATPPARCTVLAIGVFDGVHVGHQHILGQLRERSSREGLLSGVLTFANHPGAVLRPDSHISYITSLDERLDLLRDNGLDLVIPLTFDLDLSELRAREFVALLQDRLNMAGLVIGYNFALGNKREGTPEVLKALAEEMGFWVEIVEAVSANGDRVSSTTVRELVSSGDLPKAARFLGRNFTLRGQVVPGSARGRAMGFPTANLEVPADRLMPGDGVYATWAHLEGNRHMAATNVGGRPTFGEEERMVEVFILDYQGELYGSELRVEFIERLRGQVRFESPEALAAQIQQDVERTKAILGAVAAPPRPQ